MPLPKMDIHEIARRGEEIYSSQLRQQLEGKFDGQVVVINIETGEYEVDADSLAANKRALAKHPGAIFYGVRVGSPVVETFSHPAQWKQ